jgi:hypothetical protein
VIIVQIPYSAPRRGPPHHLASDDLCADGFRWLKQQFLVVANGGLLLIERVGLGDGLSLGCGIYIDLVRFVDGGDVFWR